MSGVLDRLTKLAMGALPTVQPLTAPRYASRSSELRATTFEPEAHLEIDAAPAPRTRPLSSRPMDPEAAGNISNRLDPPAPRREARTPNRMQQMESLGAEDAIERVPSITSRSEAPSAYRNDLAQEGELPQTNSAQRRPAERAESLPRNERTAIPTPGIIPRTTSAFDSQEPAIAERPSPNAEKASDAQPSSQTPPERSIQAIQPTLGAHRDSATRAEPATASPEQRTEIHISIGSIELRAPRTENKPPAPQFRPRVSLDDFLRRKPEAGA